MIGSDFTASSDKSLNGSTIGLVVGLLGLVYGVQGVTQTAQLAMATVWNIPQDQRTGFLPRLGRSLAGLITIGGAFLINSFVTTYATGGTSNYAIRVPVIVGLLVINIRSLFRHLHAADGQGDRAARADPRRDPGRNRLHRADHRRDRADHPPAEARAGDLRGVRPVIGIVTFLLLLAKLSLYAAELNPVLSRNLYPRALPLGGEPTEADLRVLSQLVHQEKRRDDQAIGVGFGDDAAEDAAADAARQRPQ